jgi:uncharacterized protein YdcH (DUF465 family)
MTLEYHPLLREFPEFQAELRALQGSDAHFARLAADYEALDKRIYLVEDGREALDSQGLQALKNERVTLNVEIARQLQMAAKGSDA